MKKIYALLMISVLFNLSVIAIALYPIDEDAIESVEMYSLSSPLQKE